MTAFRLLVDECVPAKICRALAMRMPELPVDQVGEPDAPTKGTFDDKLLLISESGQRTFITVDRRTLPGHIARHLAAGHHTWGVFIIDTESTVESVVDELELICQASEPSEWVDIIWYLPSDDLRQH